MSRAWRYSRHRGRELLVLLAIADYADDTGVAWPSVRTLAQKARVGESTAHRIIAALMRSGELEVTTQGGGRDVNRYRVTVSEAVQDNLLDTGPKSGPVPIRDRRGPAGGTAPVPRAGPRTISEPPEESSSWSAGSEHRALGAEAVRVWCAAAARCGNPYTDTAARRMIREQAAAATRWEDGAVVLAAIPAMMDARSSPRRIPEWARSYGADRRAAEHAARTRDSRPGPGTGPVTVPDGLRTIGAAAAAVARAAASR